ESPGFIHETCWKNQASLHSKEPPLLYPQHIANVEKAFSNKKNSFLSLVSNQMPPLSYFRAPRKPNVILAVVLSILFPVSLWAWAKNTWDYQNKNIYLRILSIPVLVVCWISSKVFSIFVKIFREHHH
ncbi:MAG TPA: hypothetical protein VHA52_08160, partial [Candidatus Babeliaceae bacterium]|nr:hypothetical protein [Candidatus Babeliaceae bacterium]